MTCIEVIHKNGGLEYIRTESDEEADMILKVAKTRKSVRSASKFIAKGRVAGAIGYAQSTLAKEAKRDAEAVTADLVNLANAISADDPHRGANGGAMFGHGVQVGQGDRPASAEDLRGARQHLTYLKAADAKDEEEARDEEDEAARADGRQLVRAHFRQRAKARADEDAKNEEDAKAKDDEAEDEESRVRARIQARVRADGKAKDDADEDETEESPMRAALRAYAAVKARGRAQANVREEARAKDDENEDEESRVRGKAAELEFIGEMVESVLTKASGGFSTVRQNDYVQDAAPRRISMPDVPNAPDFDRALSNSMAPRSGNGPTLDKEQNAYADPSDGFAAQRTSKQNAAVRAYSLAKPIDLTKIGNHALAKPTGKDSGAANAGSMTEQFIAVDGGPVTRDLSDPAPGVPNKRTGAKTGQQFSRRSGGN